MKLGKQFNIRMLAHLMYLLISAMWLFSGIKTMQISHRKRGIGAVFIMHLHKNFVSFSMAKIIIFQSCFWRRPFHYTSDGEKDWRQ